MGQTQRLDKTAPTDKQSHHNATDPLLMHFLYHRFGSFAHDSQGIGVGDGPHSGSAKPWHAKYSTDPSHAD